MGFLIKVILVILIWWVAGIAAAWTGAGGDKKWRRLFVPGLTAVIGLIVLWSFWAIFLMARAGAISMGYGIPDPPTQPNPDSGSPLGRFWFARLKNYKQAAIATRGTIGLLEMLSIIIIPIISGTWISGALWIIAGLLICFNNIYFSTMKTNTGSFKFRDKELLWQEVLIHGNDSAIITILIFLCR